MCNAFNAIYVNTVDTKHIHTFLPITFLIFNRFSIRKMFWKAKTKGFSTIPSILYMLILLILDIGIFLCIQCYICGSSRYILYTIYSHVMVCMSMQQTQLNYNVDSNTKSSNYSKIQFIALIYFELQQSSN